MDQRQRRSTQAPAPTTLRPRASDLGGGGEVRIRQGLYYQLFFTTCLYYMSLLHVFSTPSLTPHRVEVGLYY